MGPILFNTYINGLFLFINRAILHNNADDNTLAYFSKTLSNLIGVLEEEAGVALTWLKQNQMIANPEKFHVLLIRKDQTNTSGENFNIQGKMIKSEVKLLGIQFDHKLNSEQHISELCRTATSQLNILQRLKQYIGFDERKILVQSFVYSNFDYYLLVWYISSAKALQKIEKIQERALRFLYHDRCASYSELLLKSERCTMHVSRLRVLCIEVFKTLKTEKPIFYA